MRQRRSLLEISATFLVLHVIISLIFYEYYATYILKDSSWEETSESLWSPYLPSKISSILNRQSKWNNAGENPLEFHSIKPLTAHLFHTNGTFATKVSFEQTPPIRAEGEMGPKDRISPFPVVDEYPTTDPYLPWIHDIFPSDDFSKIIVISQNRRRCHTGKGHKETMEFLEPQIALFQPISLKDDNFSALNHSNDQFEQRHKNYTISNDKEATIKETRFQCRFKLYHNSKLTHEETTFSQYPFNYEYTTWRKRVDSMFEKEGKGMAQFWLSSLEFHCPIPRSIQVKVDMDGNKDLYLDIATIRTPVRQEGEWALKEVGDERMFDVYEHWGADIQVPHVDNSTRWENIFISLESKSPSFKEQRDEESSKPHKLVACTWASAAHNRRGDAVTLSDGKARLREWLTFNLLVGFDHVYVYDNSAANTNTTSLKEITDLFDSKHVTHIDWPCKVCNNNRPAHDDPGERSSQYAAEASCRARFGPKTDWMASLDPDEYLIPMGDYQSWKDILNNIDEDEQRKVLKFRSARARPRLNLLEPLYDTSDKKCPSPEEAADVSKPGISSCLVPRRNETFLKTYNCDYIKSPKPDRFQRAMKQVYRPDFVLSHFVHYSTITVDLARRQEDTIGKYSRAATNNFGTERFVDELAEGAMIHAKSIVPNEAISRNTRCVYKKTMCSMGIECPDSLPFIDAAHKDGFIHGQNKSYCNCWINRKAEEVWIPRLEQALKNLGG